MKPIDSFPGRRSAVSREVTALCLIAAAFTSCSDGGANGSWPGEDGGAGTSTAPAAGDDASAPNNGGGLPLDGGSLAFDAGGIGPLLDAGGLGALLDAASSVLPGDAGACVIGSAGLGALIPGATMAPGAACVSCHAATGAGKLNVAGTVYSALHEANSCLGVPTGVQVVITDSQGADHTLSVNSSGNFYDNGVLGISTPYKAKVVGTNGSVAMMSAQTSGDCNACHTSAGAQGAAGRIIGP